MLPDTAPLHARRQAWWQAPWALERFVSDLLDAEARTLRPGGPWPPHVEPPQLAATAIGNKGRGFDSLECIGLAAALSEALHLHRGGLTDTLMTAPALGAWVDAAAASLARFSDLITVRSSGSTGKRRSHIHNAATLEQEAATWAVLLPGRLRVRSAVASHHIYGLLFTHLLPANLGVEVEDIRKLSPGAVLATLRPGDLVVGYPLFWESLLRATSSAWQRDVNGVTSGARCPDETITGVLHAGLARLIDAYGSSETAGIGWRDGIGSHRLLPCWQRSGHDMLLRSDGWRVAVPDQLSWDESGGFRVGERRDGAVMVGGIIVDLARVRAVLRAHPGVMDAAVRPMRPAEGGRLKAFLVPRSDGVGDLEELRVAVADHVDATLTAAERPRAYRFGRSLPRSEAGKPADWDA